MKIQVRDIKTKQVFGVDPAADRVVLRTTDGDNVKIFPATLSVMVKRGEKFDGVTPKGPRAMELIK